VVEERTDQVSHNVYSVANVVTLLRLLLVPFFFSVLLRDTERSRIAAFALYALAASTDWVDGQIARRTHTSPAGEDHRPARGPAATCFWSDRAVCHRCLAGVDTGRASWSRCLLAVRFVRTGAARCHPSCDMMDGESPRRCSSAVSHHSSRDGRWYRERVWLGRSGCRVPDRRRSLSECGSYTWAPCCRFPQRGDTPSGEGKRSRKPRKQSESHGKGRWRAGRADRGGDDVKAVIMAGGEGTRLRPLTSMRPKPMVPIFNQPVMEHILGLVKHHGMTEVVATLAFMPKMIEDHFGDGEEWGMSITYAVEESPLGTAGSVRNAKDALSGEPSWSSRATRSPTSIWGRSSISITRMAAR